MGQRLALVTGATGCVGKAVVKALSERGWAVRRLVRETHSAESEFENHIGDLTDHGSLQGVCQGARLVVHTAACLSDWRPGREIWRVNRDGTRLLLEEALRSGVDRFVYISTVDVYGFSARSVIDECSPKLCPSYPYSRSKLAGEQLAWSFQRRGLDVTVIYPAWVFGPGDRHLLPELVRGVRDGALVHLDRGLIPIELTYSENLAEAIVLAAVNRDCVGERFIVGDSYGVTLGRLFDLIAEQIGVLPPRWSIPLPVAKVVAEFAEFAAMLAGSGDRPMLTRYAVRSLGGGMRYDLTKIRSIGYSPRLNLEGALRTSLDNLGLPTPLARQ